MIRVAIFASVALAVQCHWTQAQDVTKVTKITGELTRDDPLDEMLKHPCKVHEFKMGQGKSFVIRLKSIDFDAFLILQDSKRQQLAFNDDDPHEPATLNSKLVYSAPNDDTYRIVVTSLDNKVGKYELTIEAASKAQMLISKSSPPAPGHQVLVAKANQLTIEGAKLFQSGKSKEAAEKICETLEIFKKIFPKDRYPQGHFLLATCLTFAGVLFADQAQYVAAEAYYRDALAINRALHPKDIFPNGDDDIVRNLDLLGNLFVSKGEYAKAEPTYREALAMCRALYDKVQFPQGHAEIAQNLLLLGSSFCGEGDYAKAEPYFYEALAMCLALYDKVQFPLGHPLLATSLDNLGVALLKQGEYVKAEHYFRDGLTMRQALFPKGHLDQFASLNNLGGLYMVQGEYGKAEPHLRSALAIGQVLFPKDRYPQGHQKLAISLNNMGQLLERQGEYAKAEIYYRDSLEMSQMLYPKTSYPKGHGDIAAKLNNLGFLLQSQGQYVQAEVCLRDALAMWQALYPKDRYPEGHSDVANGLNNLGMLFFSKAEYAQALPYFRDSQAMRISLYPKSRHPQGHPQLIVGLNNLGHALRELGEYDKAEPYLREALVMCQALYSKGHPDLIRGLGSLGILHGARGEYVKALPYCRDALAMQQFHFARLAETAAEAQALNFAASLPTALDSFLSIQRQIPEDSSAYDLVWKSRAPITQILQRRHLDAFASHDPDAKKLALDLQSARQRLAYLLLSPAKNTIEHKKALGDLTETKEDLEKRLALQLGLNPSSTAANTSPQHLSKAIPQGSAFIDVVRYTDWYQDPKVPGKKGTYFTPRFVAFILLSGKPALRVDLGAAAPIEQAWAAWHKAIVNNLPDRQAAAALAALIWQPLRKHLPANTHTVWLAPDGQLTQVPWAALPGAQPNTILLEEIAVAVVPHGTYLLQHLQDKPAAPGAKANLLIVGGVAYEQAPSGSASNKDLTLAPTDKLMTWPALPGTASEQAQIAGLASKALQIEPVVLQGAAAGFAQVSAELPKARFAHLATHGFFADPKFRSAFQIDEKQFLHFGSERKTAGARSPLVLSGLVLAGANKPETPQRGIMTAEAVVGLRLEDLELVVLSACETGLGETAGGEGAFGLQRAFHVAGARNVIASLWNVNDKATAALMVLFYHKLWVEQRPSLQALREAQLTLYRHPDAIADLAGDRGPVNQAATVKLVTQGGPAPAAGKSAPVRLWAAFYLSGVGQ